MKRNGNLLLLYYAGACLVFLAGLAFTAATTGRMSFQRERLQGRKNALLALRDFERVRNDRQSAVLAFELLESSEPVSLSVLAADYLAGAESEIRVRESIDLPGGWVLRRMEMLCPDLDLDRLPAFLHAAETGRPPWRLSECHITASRRDGGYGRVVLIMEGLAKPDR